MTPFSSMLEAIETKWCANFFPLFNSKYFGFLMLNNCFRDYHTKKELKITRKRWLIESGKTKGARKLFGFSQEAVLRKLQSDLL